MSERATHSRRDFLMGSAALGGGVLFGSYDYADQLPLSAVNPLAAGLGAGSVALNPWVEIGPETITLIAQHTDLGQGVGSIQPIMIAEELDVEPDQFEIRFAGPSPAYFNTGLAEELAPFLAADHSAAAESARAVALENLRKSGLQTTGASSTIADTYEKMRVAGAVARETMKATASRRTGIPTAQLHTAQATWSCQAERRSVMLIWRRKLQPSRRSHK
jgi:isoquinoline 1-oxidoreductase subunit beta